MIHSPFIHSPSIFHPSSKIHPHFVHPSLIQHSFVIHLSSIIHPYLIHHPPIHLSSIIDSTLIAFGTTLMISLEIEGGWRQDSSLKTIAGETVLMELAFRGSQSTFLHFERRVRCTLWRWMSYQSSIHVNGINEDRECVLYPLSLL
jgi:hypothetical protein